jgi:hypothetical protein
MHRAKANSSSARPQLPVTPETTPQDLRAFAQTIPQASALRAKKKGGSTFLYAGPAGREHKTLAPSFQRVQKETAKHHLAAQLVGYVLRHIEARDGTVVIDGAKIPQAKATLLDLIDNGTTQHRLDGFTDLLDALVQQDAGPYGKLIGEAERGYLRFKKGTIENRFEPGRELLVQYLLNSASDAWLLESLKTILGSEGDQIDWRLTIANSADFVAGHIETLEQPKRVLSIPPYLDVFCERWTSARKEGVSLCAQLPFALLLDDVAAMVQQKVKKSD